MARPKHTPEQHLASFWSRVDRSGGPDACWPWVGSITTQGYGQFRHQGHDVGAHRVSYELHFGPVPKERPYVCHTCDNPPCVNPRHLWAGSGSDNQKDAQSKGRKPFAAQSTRKGRPRGESHRFVKLTAVDVIEIRGSLLSAATLAARYDLSENYIYALKSRQRWRWLN